MELSEVGDDLPNKNTVKGPNPKQRKDAKKVPNKLQ